ncbi:hypothetical protein RclHR1_02500029 [Rhizophagus clarus]|uniref:Uncharacterized protein n=1 Tax=Rhizophagus clarus TaxID=94130 RepID=A0A2Z6QZ23_9GLOM|nr:hypothetical protein RclHR1_02500029 [Rhizophagus clarus]GET01348.1 hypothetical protein GLOIN_2v1603048 [Rhizophagus clarus]
MFEVFKRRNSDASRRKIRIGNETKQVYEDECRRLINVVEHLTEQRKESVEIIRLVNKGLSDLISSLQKKHPKNDNVTPIPEELLNTVSTQLLNSIQAQNSVQAQLEGELLDDENDAFVGDSEGNEGNFDKKRQDDDGLKTELVILQSQMNRLRTEQDKLTTSKQQKNTNGIGESSNHVHKRRSTGLNDSFNFSKDSLPESDYSGINTGKDDDAYETIKKQEKEIHKLRKKIKIYEDQIKEYASSVNGTMNDGHMEGSTSGVKDEIKKLQRSFLTFTTLSDGEIKINQDAANELLESYQLGSFQDDSKSKIRLAAALESKITSLLNERVEGYFAVKDTYLEDDYDDDNLEYDLVNTTEKLCELLNRFTGARASGDTSLRKTCTKLRSLIYSSLSTSSFSTFENDTHPFITSLVSQLLKFMEGCRTLPSAESLQVKEEAKQIILRFISLIYFKLKSIDPQPKLVYYNQGTNVDEHNMKGAWDKTDVSNQIVDICYFPAVIVNQKNNSNTISKAQVLSRHR